MPGQKPRHKPGEPPIRPIDYTVNGNGCWVWNWSVHRKGYASVWVNGRGVKAHRVAYELANGPIPEGMIIRHTCNNPSCVNPEHLEAGTPAENARDMVADGKQGNQKFLPSDAAEIRRLFAAGGISRQEIARQYGVTAACIRPIVANKTFYDPAYTPPPPGRNRSEAGGLDADMARQIRQLYSAGGLSQREIALQFGLHPATVSQIVRNRHYPDPDYVVPERKAVNQKLTVEQAHEIREKVRQGFTQSALAKEYGVGQGTIAHIKAGKIHTGTPRQYSAREYAESPPRPTLKSVDGPALTGKAKQAERRRELNPDIRPKHQPGEPLITERDWTLDPATGCHNWRWGNKRYRASITLEDGVRRLAYHVNWELHNGPISEGYQINHQCNNHRCVNPEHLYLGDQFENVRDMRRVGNLAMQKLSWPQVREIRAKYEPGKTTHKELAREYRVHLSTIGDIVNNITFHDPGYTSKAPEVSVRRALTDADAVVIRRRYRDEQVSMSELAHDFGVKGSTIARIISNKHYSDAAYTPPTAAFIRRRRDITAGEKIASGRRAADGRQSPLL